MNRNSYEPVIERLSEIFGADDNLRYVTVHGHTWDICEPLSDKMNDLLNSETAKPKDWLRNRQRLL